MVGLTDRFIKSNTPPSNRQPKGCRKMLCLDAQQGFCEDVCCHVVGWAVEQDNLSFVNNELNEVITDVDVLCAHVEMAIFGQGDHT